MEDRYLYKAKRISDGEWVIGHYVNYCYQNEKDKTGHFILKYPNKYYEIYTQTICQCTGMKDKNGKLIWENDIVAYWDTYNTESGMSESDCIGEVVWEEETLSFEVTNRLSAESYEVLEDCSVIGNKFDNPELLESEE